MALETLLKELVLRDGSDLYVTVGSPPLVHAGGQFVPTIEGERLTTDDVRALVKEALPPSDLAAFEKTGDANAAYALKGSDRFRVNAFRQRNEPGMVIRRIKTVIPSLESLNLPPILGRLVLERRGLIFVTGSTGSGKSTTLAAMIDRRNASVPGHIVTLEDPIEFVHEHKESVVSQREIGFDTPSYGEGLKNALRQAPSVLLIGEIRDAETAEAALHFADTGHLVLATLHSTNASQTLTRLLHLFPPAAERHVLHQLSLNLKAIVSQRLVRKSDGSGRVAAIEVLLNTPRVQDLMKDGRIEDIKEAMLQSAGDGAMTFDSHLFELLLSGAISEEDALASADSANDLRLRIRLASGSKSAPSSIRIVGG